jgi:hypothetical protein
VTVLKKRRRRTKYEPVPGFHLITIRKEDDVDEDPCTLYKSQWVCWANPESTGANFSITFVGKSPLKGAPAVIKVKRGTATLWYKRKGSEKKGESFKYHVVEDVRGPVAPPGPEIIAGDG